MLQFEAFAKVSRERGADKQAFVLGDVGKAVRAGKEIHAILEYEEHVKVLGGYFFNHSHHGPDSYRVQASVPNQRRPTKKT